MFGLEFHLFRFYGIDWLAAIVVVLVHTLLGRRCRWAFLLNMLAAVLWGIVGLMSGTGGLTLLNLVIFFISWRNFLKWKKDDGK